jgi:chromosome segregation ATPase
MSSNTATSSKAAAKKVIPPKGGKKVPLKREKAELKRIQKEVEQGKGAMEFVISNYMTTRARLSEAQKEVRELTARKEELESEFDFLRKIDDRILEAGRNVAGIGEGVKKLEKENEQRKRKRESREKEVVKLRRLLDDKEFRPSRPEE